MPCLWLDATYAKRGSVGHVAQAAVVTAMGCDSAGRRHVLGFGAVDTEPPGSLLAFLREIRSRGVLGVRLVASDACEGLERAGPIVPRLSLDGPVLPLAAGRRGGRLDTSGGQQPLDSAADLVERQPARL